MEKERNKKRFSIPEYDVDVEFAQNIIQVLDCTTEKLLDRCNMEEKGLLELDQVVRRSFSSFRAKSNSGKNFLVNLKKNNVKDYMKLGEDGRFCDTFFIWNFTHCSLR